MVLNIFISCFFLGEREGGGVFGLAGPGVSCHNCWNIISFIIFFFGGGKRVGHAEKSRCQLSLVLE